MRFETKEQADKYGKSLIGKSFKRNVYGLSKWTDVVENYNLVWCVSSEGNSYKIYVNGGLYISRSKHPYYLDEIVIWEPNVAGVYPDGENVITKMLRMDPPTSLVEWSEGKDGEFTWRLANDK